MRKPYVLAIVIVLIAALAVPSVALAGSKGHGGPKSKITRVKPQAARQAAHREAKALKRAGKQASLESSPTSPSIDATKSVGPGVANALSHILANIQRKIAKFGGDLKASYGLVKVWVKFSTWLGQPTDVKPWETSPTVPGGGTTSPTVDPPVVPTVEAPVDPAAIPTPPWML